MGLMIKCRIYFCVIWRMLHSVRIMLYNTWSKFWYVAFTIYRKPFNLKMRQIYISLLKRTYTSLIKKLKQFNAVHATTFQSKALYGKWSKKWSHSNLFKNVRAGILRCVGGTNKYIDGHQTDRQTDKHRSIRKVVLNRLV